MDSIKHITKTEFLRYFNMLQKGNPEKAWVELAYAVYKHIDFVTNLPVDIDMILKQWEKYAQKCHNDKTDPRFIKAMDKWIKDKDYQTEYKSSSSTSYLDKYKKKP